MFQFLEAANGAATAAQANTGKFSLIYSIGMLVFFFVIFYFFIMRPQKKEQRRQDELIASVEIGDSILAKAGFYGVVIDVMDEVVIVEFGNNKNCRIPMKKTYIAEVEKPISPDASESK